MEGSDSSAGVTETPVSPQRTRHWAAVLGSQTFIDAAPRAGAGAAKQLTGTPNTGRMRLT